MLRIFTAASFALVALPAVAEDISLEFDFVTHTSDSITQQFAEGDAGTLAASKAFGVARFSDGRRAIKKFVVVSGGGAPISGISNYMFENGDGVTASFVIDAQFNGTYTVVGGSGAYADATGSGTFSPVQVEAWAAGGDTTAWSGTFQLTTP